MPLAFGDPRPEGRRLWLPAKVSRAEAIVPRIECNCQCFSNSGAKHLQVGFFQRPKPRDGRFPLLSGHGFQGRALGKGKDVGKPRLSRGDNGTFDVDADRPDGRNRDD